MSLKCQPSTTFAANRGSQSAREAELCQICQGDPQRAFSEILQSCDQGKLFQKEGHKKTPWRECHHVLFKIFFKCQPSTTFCCKPRLLKCPWSRAMSNLPRRPSARVFWNSAKLRPGETPAKRRPQKTPWHECHHVLINISLKCQPSTTFCCKPHLPKCREAELCQICQGDPQRAFSEVLQSCDQGKLLQKEGHKKHPGANAIMS